MHFDRFILFSSISQLLVLSIVPFGDKNLVFPALAFPKTFPGMLLSGLQRHHSQEYSENCFMHKLGKLGFFSILGTLYRFFKCCWQNVLFANYCLVFFLFLQIKTSGFHLKEEGNELLGMLMAALANTGYCILCICPLSKIGRFVCKTCQFLFT